MALTIFQLAADLHDEDGFLFLCKSIFALFRGQVGVTVVKFLRGDKSNLPI